MSEPLRLALKLGRQVTTMEKNVNKDALVQAIVAKTDLTKKDVESVLEAMIDVVTAELSSGNKVTMTGFGTFRVSKRASRTGVNPRNPSMKIKIPSMTLPAFKAGKSLKDAVR